MKEDQLGELGELLFSNNKDNSPELIAAFNVWLKQNEFKARCCHHLVKSSYFLLAAAIAALAVVPFGPSAKEGAKYFPFCSVNNGTLAAYEAMAQTSTYALNWSLNTYYLFAIFSSLVAQLPCSSHKIIAQSLGKQSITYSFFHVFTVIIKSIFSFASALPFSMLSRANGDPLDIVLATHAAFTALHYSGSLFLLEMMRHLFPCCPKKKLALTLEEKWQSLPHSTKATLPTDFSSINGVMLFANSVNTAYEGLLQPPSLLVCKQRFMIFFNVLVNLIVVFATLSSLIGYFLESQAGLEDYFNMTDSDVSNLTRHDSKFSESLSWIFAIFAFIPFIGISIKVPISAINDLFKKYSHAQDNTQPGLQKLQKIIFYPALILLALFAIASSSPSIELNYKFLSALDPDILLVLNVLTVSSVAVFNAKDAAFVLKKGLFKCQACKGGESKTYQKQENLIKLVMLDESKFRHLIQVGV